MSLFIKSIASADALGYMMAGFAGMFIFLLMFVLIIAIIGIVVNWKLFERAGEEGWKSIIPFYNTYITIKIGLGADKAWLLFIMIGSSFISKFIDNGMMASIIGLASAIITIYVSYSFFRRFASEGMSVGAVLLPFIFGTIIAFGDYPYTPLYNEHQGGNDYYGY